MVLPAQKLNVRGAGSRESALGLVSVAMSVVTLSPLVSCVITASAESALAVESLHAGSVSVTATCAKICAQMVRREAR